MTARGAFVLFIVTAASVMERVSGNIVEFQMDSLSPATHYTVKVYAMRDSAKSATTSTDFTTGTAIMAMFPHLFQSVSSMFFFSTNNV